MTYQCTLRRLLAAGDLNLPFPASGRTADRHERLLSIAQSDVGLARLAEAHVDAMAILAEAGRAPVAGALYGVWASESSQQSVLLVRTESGPRLSGTEAFCTGAGIVDRALVTVAEPGRLLVDVDLRATLPHLRFDHTGWVAPAFAGTATAAVGFVDVPLSEDHVIGPDRWYLDRVGFWHGACGPAACWAGGAIGLVDHAIANASDSPHTQAHVGALAAAAWSVRAVLTVAGHEIDSDPENMPAARTRALTVRHLVEQHATEIITRYGRAMGPRPLAHDAAVIRRTAGVQLYLGQHGGERDLEALGTSITAP